jgi:hypothetical protein
MIPVTEYHVNASGQSVASTTSRATIAIDSRPIGVEVVLRLTDLSPRQNGGQAIALDPQMLGQLIPPLGQAPLPPPVPPVLPAVSGKAAKAKHQVRLVAPSYPEVPPIGKGFPLGWGFLQDRRDVPQSVKNCCHSWLGNGSNWRSRKLTCRWCCLHLSEERNSNIKNWTINKAAGRGSCVSDDGSNGPKAKKHKTTDADKTDSD